MSKAVKQMEMDAMKQTFKDVRDLVVLSPKGVSAGLDHGLRTSLRKKNIRLMMVKNSLCRRVFKDLGMKVPDDSPYWANTTWVAWGPESVGELSKEIDTAVFADVKFKDKVTVKGAICEGSPLDFETAKTIPTKAEALGRIAALILGPGGQLAAAILGPGGQLAAQVKSKGEEKKDEAAPAA
jgi:large subunit ribosomal protein L10